MAPKKYSNKEWAHLQGHGSNIKGMEQRAINLELPVIEAKNIDEEWLKPCIVGIIKQHTKMRSIQVAMASDGVHDIKIKPMVDNKVDAGFLGVSVVGACGMGGHIFWLDAVLHVFSLSFPY
ncbi:hypothetical protein U1Q18_032075 [Sarracenia purpurea var. burkii]